MKPRSAAALAVIGVLLLTGGADLWVRGTNTTLIERQSAANADRLADEIADVVDSSAAAVDILAAFAKIELDGPRGDLVGEFPAFAAVVLAHDESIRSVQLAEGTTLTYVYPIEGNEAAIGLDLLADPGRRALLEPSIATGAMTVQGPVSLVQGGTGVIVRRPLYLADGGFWGFAALVLDWDRLLTHTRLAEDDGFVAGIRDESGVTIAGNGEAFDGGPLLRPVASDLTDVVWLLASRPKEGWPGAAPASPFVWVFGLQAAILAGLFTFHAVRRPMVLRAEIERATAKLAESDLRYRELFASIPIGIQQEDYSAAIEHLRGLSQAGVGDLRAYLDTHQGELEHILTLVPVASNPSADLFQVGLGRGAGTKTLLRVLTPETRESLIESLVSVSEGRRDAEWQIESEGSDGARRRLHLRWHVPDKDGTPDFGNLLMTVTDVSLLRRTEQRLAGLLEAKDRFVASVAHELRTPLTAVIGFSRALLDEDAGLSVAETVELRDLIASHAQEMAHIIEDLLVTGRSDLSEVRIHLETIDLSSVAGEALFGVPGADFEVTVSDGPILTLGDPVRVRQIVRNLITNAIRYGGPNTRISVHRVRGLSAVDVSDDGPPIPADEAERIFEPYERVAAEHSKPGSIGLGLTVSRSLAELQGGQLTLVRERERNVFRLTMPALDRAAVSESA